MAAAFQVNFLADIGDPVLDLYNLSQNQGPPRILISWRKNFGNTNLKELPPLHVKSMGKDDNQDRTGLGVIPSRLHAIRTHACYLINFGGT